jgi:transcriptional regulator with XRE-family HTH domain
MKQFGEFLAEKRRERGLTLRKLGALAKISASYLSEIENGSKPPPKEQEKLNNLAIVLGVDLLLFKKKATAQRDIEKSTGIFEKLFGHNTELAMSLYRQTEDKSEQDLDELKDLFEQAIQNWKEKHPDGK